MVSDGFGGDSSPAVGNGCAGTCVAGALIKTIDPSAITLQLTIFVRILLRFLKVNGLLIL